MQYKNIITAACTLMGSLSGIASADINPPLGSLNSADKSSRPFSAIALEKDVTVVTPSDDDSDT